jgi:hypothetical protein
LAAFEMFVKVEEEVGMLKPFVVVAATFELMEP